MEKPALEPIHALTQRVPHAHAGRGAGGVRTSPTSKDVDVEKREEEKIDSRISDLFKVIGSSP